MSFPGPRRDFRSSFRRNDRHGFSGNSRDCHHAAGAGVAPSLKRKRSLGCASYQQLDTITSVPSTSHCLYPVPMRPDLLPRYECEEPRIEGDVSFMSRDEIERLSPSRKDGIDSLRETHLRYSYCAFLQNLGMRLELPQTTIGTAMVLCHRFFVRRSHACHDRFNWFEQYRERVIEAEQMILTTLNFELNVQHPYIPLTSVLSKLGLSQSALVNLAWNLVNEGLRSSLWLQFKPHHIAAGAAFLAAKFLNLDLASYQSMWQEFQTTPVILQDVVQQLMELF
ncbi:cyclin-T1-5-like isoform X3 [Magnolia sinica]|uniref:cyclin-T1-5-like isoform X3 n=1 Tax=Magnolia sinica TaxID=86752 RepID=UPI00265B39AC|nr:cyclin-T1-5-like isoform X3 [Magnolia sinica]